MNDPFILDLHMRLRHGAAAACAGGKGLWRTQQAHGRALHTIIWDGGDYLAEY